MPTPTYTPLANITLGSAAATVTFSSISQAYRDLVLIVQATPTSNTVGLRMRFNTDTGSNYSYVWALGDGSTTSSGSGTTTRIEFEPGLARDTTSNSNSIANIMDYSATDKHKPVLVRSNIIGGTYPGTVMTGQRWASTSAITTIEVFFGSGNIAAGSVLALYGVAA
jgi:hypothetical protein